jgi:hypothetical protein
MRNEEGVFCAWKVLTKLRHMSAKEIFKKPCSLDELKG